jgi:plasmid stabilization system protein ParE
MDLQAHVRPASDPSLDQVRSSVTALVAELQKHLDGLADLPAGPTSFARLADLNEPVRRAVAHWDHAVFAHTETLPVAVDDGWSEDFID